MNTDYLYLNDVIYSFSEDVKVIFHTEVAHSGINGKVYNNYNEYKINNRDVCNTMIKRRFVYNLFLEDKRPNVKGEKIAVYPEDMLELLDKLKFIESQWVSNPNSPIYAYMDDSLQLIDHNICIFIKLSYDKILKITPGIMKTDSGDFKCLDFYFNSQEPMQVSYRNFNGFLYILDSLDMASFANTSFLLAMMMNNPVNRTDFSVSKDVVELEDKSKIEAPEGRTFSSYKRKRSIFDD